MSHWLCTLISRHQINWIWFGLFSFCSSVCKLWSQCKHFLTHSCMLLADILVNSHPHMVIRIVCKSWGTSSPLLSIVRWHVKDHLVRKIGCSSPCGSTTHSLAIFLWSPYQQMLCCNICKSAVMSTSTTIRFYHAWGFQKCLFCMSFHQTEFQACQQIHSLIDILSAVESNSFCQLCFIEVSTAAWNKHTWMFGSNDDECRVFDASKLQGTT